jgi:hypothetical protein
MTKNNTELFPLLQVRAAFLEAYIKGYNELAIKTKAKNISYADINKFESMVNAFKAVVNKVQTRMVDIESIYFMDQASGQRKAHLKSSAYDAAAPVLKINQEKVFYKGIQLPDKLGSYIKSIFDNLGVKNKNGEIIEEVKISNILSMTSSQLIVANIEYYSHNKRDMVPTCREKSYIAIPYHTTLVKKSYLLFKELLLQTYKNLPKDDILKKQAEFFTTEMNLRIHKIIDEYKYYGSLEYEADLANIQSCLASEINHGE